MKKIIYLSIALFFTLAASAQVKIIQISSDNKLFLQDCPAYQELPIGTIAVTDTATTALGDGWTDLIDVGLIQSIRSSYALLGITVGTNQKFVQKIKAPVKTKKKLT